MVGTDNKGKMKGVELFAGSCVFSETARDRGHEMFSIDYKPAPGVSRIMDIEDLKAKDVPFVPDFAWASVPCTSYTLAAVSHHREDDGSYAPTSKFAAKSDRMIVKMLMLFDEWLSKNPNFVFYIENPRATLRKMDFMEEFERATVWYCRYGDSSAKPTDVFSNNLYSLFNPNGWIPRPMCFNDNPNCHHERAPRGSDTGTQGKSGNYERSILPKELCLEVIEATEKSYERKN